LFSIIYLVVRRLLGALAVIVRRELSKDVELLVLRHENTVLGRHVGRPRYTPATGCGWPRYRGYSPVHTGHTCVRRDPRRCWPGTASS
jgi:hypothetical protein